MSTKIFSLLFIFSFSCMFLTACGNNNSAEVPANIKVETGPVTGEIVVKHVITIELPTVFTDSCKSQHPDDEVAYNECVTKYINELLNIINSINPEQLPVQP
ncbi:MAG: hypothetical protein HC836_45590 [Richelia sp. RM2_1_2]|nr:hypothetical protein [Richelia sp. RM2_1_2]